MRRIFVGAAALTLSLVGSSCGAREAQPDPENVMVLELGGSHPLLRQRLALPEKAPDPVPAAAVAEPGPQPDPRPRTSAPAQASTPAAPRYREVVLGKGETLIGLCRRWLGDGNRWREVAALNGISEDEVQRLRIGARLRFPPR